MLRTIGKGTETKTKKKTLVIALFSHIESYPPSLNALLHLAPLYEKVYVIMRNTLISEWQYPDNVELIYNGKYVAADEVRHLSLFDKLKSYLTFGRALRKVVTQARPSLILLYDTLAFSIFNLLAWNAVSHLKPLIWYHNHDVTVDHEVGRFSIMRLMGRLEHKYFSRIDIFSLPTVTRLSFFRVDRLKHPPVILPNYPSLHFFGKWKSSPPANGVIRLVFQGHISRDNGVEDFIKVLSSTVRGNRIELHLAGPIHKAFEDHLVSLAEKLNVKNRLFIYGRLPYAQLPALTASCHIGLGIYGSHNVMVRTMGTASNKVFEYSSVGLPVILYDGDQFRKLLGQYEWSFFTDGSATSILQIIDTIIADFERYSKSARHDFETSLNFENYFNPVINDLK